MLHLMLPKPHIFQFIWIIIFALHICLLTRLPCILQTVFLLVYPLVLHHYFFLSHTTCINVAVGVYPITARAHRTGGRGGDELETLTLRHAVA